MPPAAKASGLRFDKLLDVNSVLELGYSLHVTNDPKTETTKAGKIARKLVDEFYSWTAPIGSSDHIYLYKMRGLAVSLGNGITRRKTSYLKETEAAEGKRSKALEEYKLSRNDDLWSMMWMSAATAAGIMAVAAAIGFALAETVLPFVPLHSEHQQAAIDQAGYWPSILVAGLFAAISRNASKWLSQRKLEKVFSKYEIARHHAWIRYQKGKLAEYERTEKEIRRLYKEYTGREPSKCVSYAAVLNEEISTDRSLNREREKLAQNVLVRTLQRFRRLRKLRIQRKNGHANGKAVESAPVERLNGPPHAVTDPPFPT